jgi:hypothetical protein
MGSSARRVIPGTRPSAGIWHNEGIVPGLTNPALPRDTFDQAMARAGPD